jgi:hypothetical protein
MRGSRCPQDADDSFWRILLRGKYGRIAENGEHVTGFSDNLRALLSSPTEIPYFPNPATGAFPLENGTMAGTCMPRSSRE